MASEHVYLSTACWHALNDGDPEMHTSCRNQCKFCPAGCACRCHASAGTQPGRTSSVDQARGTALRLLQHLTEAGVDLAERDPHLARALAEDPAFFWARGEERPPGEWRPTAGEEER
jgi:hypothetical protein